MTEQKIHKKKLQALQTREAILEAATKCFAENGYPGCSLDLIAMAAGITKGAVYNHFESKSALFAAIIERAYEHAQAAASAMETTLPRIEAIIALLRACFKDGEFPIDHRLWAEILAVANRDGEIRSVFIQSQAKFRNILKRWICEGIRSGEIRTDVDAQNVTRLLFALGNGLVVRLGCGPDFASDHSFEIIEKTVRFHLQNPL